MRSKRRSTATSVSISLREQIKALAARTLGLRTKPTTKSRAFRNKLEELELVRRGDGRSRARAQPTGPDAPRLRRGLGDSHLPHLGHRTPLERRAPKTSSTSTKRPKVSRRRPLRFGERSKTVLSSTWPSASSSLIGPKRGNSRRAKSTAALSCSSPGLPGSGKTSIAKSIAKALGREYVRISLGGAQRRVGYPRTPPYLHRLDAGAHYPRYPPSGHQKPGLFARRNR